MDLDDVGIIDSRRQLGLALESPGPVRILGPPWLDYLDRDLARQAAVPPSVDAPEGALPNDGLKLIAPVEREAAEIRCTWCGCSR
jgi:hypothetical protein